MPRLCPLGAALLWLPLFRWGAASRLRSEAATASTAGYLIASFPNTQQVNYARLPDTAWLQLVPSTGITAPEALSVDPVNMRLFVADPPVGMVYWYQLDVSEDGRLTTDGVQHLAAHSVAAAGLACDSVGTLYMSGQLRGASSMSGIFKQEAAAFAKDIPPVPPAIWTPPDTDLQALGPQLNLPGGLAVDAVHVYWGNAVVPQNGTSVVQAASVPPNRSQMQAVAYQAALRVALRPLADDANAVRGLALIPEGILYATSHGVHGVLLGNAGQGCGPSGVRCPLVAAMQDPTSLVWDGDGTVLVADRTAGSVFSFPSGTIQQHHLEKVVDAHGINGLALLPESEAKASAQKGGEGVMGWLFGSF
uniref:SMP-30/Gluconolactonase/LRE-like region domain-containing protein n=1 Tax=Alexandrium catenella TaxID=2925 RepID=A0A7S1PRZ0_ALECA